MPVLKVAIGSSAVVLVVVAVVAFSAGWVRFYALVCLALCLLFSVIAIGGTAAYQQYRAGNVVTAVAVGLMIPVVCLIIGYVVVGLQAESTTAFQVGRNALLSLVAVGVVIWIVATADRWLQTSST